MKKITAHDTPAVKSSSCKKQLDEDFESPLRPAIILKEGSVLDVLKNPGKIMAIFKIVWNLNYELIVLF